MVSDPLADWQTVSDVWDWINKLPPGVQVVFGAIAAVLTALFGTFAAPGQNGNLLTSFGIGTRPRRDSFAGRNASAIVFEMNLDVVAPRSANGARPKLRAWGTTGRLVR